MNRGYIKLFRKIEECAIFENEPQNRFGAWVDLLMMANHKDGSFMIGMTKYNVKRGQKWTSMVKLADRWNWSRKRVRVYLNLLESEGMIYQEITNRGLLITIVNYGKYQDFLGQSEQQTLQPKLQQTLHQRNIKGNSQGNSQGNTNNNVKNDIKNDIKNESKNVNKPTASFGFLGDRGGGIVYEE